MGSRKPDGIIQYPIESFQGTLKIKIKNKFYKWLVLKKSTIQGAGFGLFAARQFNKGDFIGRFMGRVLDRDTKDVSEYAIATFKYLIDPMGEINSGYPWYWGLHIANDPTFVGRGLNDQSSIEKMAMINAIIHKNMLMSAKVTIKMGQEIFISYNY